LRFSAMTLIVGSFFSAIGCLDTRYAKNRLA